MVYRGKPSAACGECRKRRSRCDQAIPACGQCVKVGRLCPGYRNIIDLMFHDESQQIVHRNSSRTSESNKSRSSRAGFKENAFIRAVAALPVKLTDFIMCQPMDDLGINFFMSTYVGENPAVSHLYYLPKFYAKRGYSDPGLHQGVMAAGLAGYANLTRNKEMSDTATRRYLGSIQSINAAISNPTTAMQDSTLMSIVTAAMFEAVVVPQLSALENCTKHLNGAVAIALLKLKQDGPTNIAQKLFYTIVQSVIINCWITHASLPPNFAELKRQVDAKTTTPSVHGNFLGIVMELVQFRQALNDGTAQHPVAIIKWALAIDDRLIKFSEDMPIHGQYKAFRTSSKQAEELAFDGYYHVYPQRFTAHLWNNARSSRIRLHQVILRQCHLLLSSSPIDNHNFYEEQQVESEEIIQKLAIEIAATVPQLTGYLEQLATNLPTEQVIPLRFSNMSPTPTPSRRPSELSERYPECINTEFQADTIARIYPPAKGPPPASLYHILFQLYSLQSIPTLSTTFKKWMLGCIRWMESSANPTDLARLQAMTARRVADGLSDDDKG
ncbi:hypothetical protein GQ44DRAFT_615041 [Phaeosphaeriaceae sp. PMI808]|nr:hypothetical protein GQ44DRAFT_615041 [Phaeosphaeriaceae sp. PMI808]